MAAARCGVQLLPEAGDLYRLIYSRDQLSYEWTFRLNCKRGGGAALGHRLLDAILLTDGTHENVSGLSEVFQFREKAEPPLLCTAAVWFFARTEFLHRSQLDRISPNWMLEGVTQLKKRAESERLAALETGEAAAAAAASVGNRVVQSFDRVAAAARHRFVETLDKHVTALNYKEKVRLPPKRPVRGQGDCVELEVQPVQSGSSVGGAAWYIQIPSAAVPCGVLLTEFIKFTGDSFFDPCKLHGLHLPLRIAAVRFPFSATPNYADQPRKAGKHGRADPSSPLDELQKILISQRTTASHAVLNRCRAYRSALHLISRTLAKGGNCLVPVETPHQAAKLLTLLYEHVAVLSLEFQIVFVHPSGGTVLEYIRSNFSWLSEKVRKRFATTRTSPLDTLSRVIAATTAAEAIQRSDDCPTVFVSCPGSLSEGPTAALFLFVCSQAASTVLLLTPPEAWTKDAAALIGALFPDLQAGVEVRGQGFVDVTIRERRAVSEEQQRRLVQEILAALGVQGRVKLQQIKDEPLDEALDDSRDSPSKSTPLLIDAANGDFYDYNNRQVDTTCDTDDDEKTQRLVNILLQPPADDNNTATSLFDGSPPTYGVPFETYVAAASSPPKPKWSPEKEELIPQPEATGPLVGITVSRRRQILQSKEKSVTTRNLRAEAAASAAAAVNAAAGTMTTNLEEARLRKTLSASFGFYPPTDMVERSLSGQPVRCTALLLPGLFDEQWAGEPLNELSFACWLLNSLLPLPTQRIVLNTECDAALVEALIAGFAEQQQLDCKLHRPFLQIVGLYADRSRPDSEGSDGGSEGSSDGRSAFHVKKGGAGELADDGEEDDEEEENGVVNATFEWFEQPSRLLVTPTPPPPTQSLEHNAISTVSDSLTRIHLKWTDTTAEPTAVGQLAEATSEMHAATAPILRHIPHLAANSAT